MQKATDTLSDRIKKFGDLLKSGENIANKTKGISLQRLSQPRSTVFPEEQQTTRSILENDALLINDKVVSSTNSFSVYPCSKCYKDLQQCDLTLPSCNRCIENNFECVYAKTEPKANHVSQVLNTMNKVMDQWQDSIDKMAKDFAQKTRDFGQRVDQSFKKNPLQPFAWKITTTNKGLSVESTVNSFNDLSTLVDQFERTMHISPRENEAADALYNSLEQMVEMDDTSSTHGFSFGVWNPRSRRSQEVSSPMDINPELTNSLVELYCRTPCCSGIRLPIIDTTEFLARYHDSDPSKRPSSVLISAVCAMAARNAFQMHIWSRKSPQHTPLFNMGKALSISYCLKGREQLAECFDEPSLDNCQAAFLLAYCNNQNGYPGVTYIYEWIAFTMAQELGLYSENRSLTRTESMLVWCLYYFNTWYHVLQGASSDDQLLPTSPLPPPLPKPELDYMMDIDFAEPPQEMIDYYIYTEWYCMIQLQVLRQEMMSRLVQAQALGKHDTTLSVDLMAMQDKLQKFYDTLPMEWKSPDLESIALDQLFAGTPDDLDESQQYHHVDIHEFARFCFLNVHVYYNINKILLYQLFCPSDHMPTSPFSTWCLNTCIDAAYAITQTLDIMVKHRDECNIPLLGFLFANMVYIKLLNYNNIQYQEFAKRCLEQSLNVCKMSKAYLYDFEMTQDLVTMMEKDIYNACGETLFSIIEDNNTYTFPPPAFQ